MKVNGISSMLISCLFVVFSMGCEPIMDAVGEATSEGAHGEAADGTLTLDSSSQEAFEQSLVKIRDDIVSGEERQEFQLKFNGVIMHYLEEKDFDAEVARQEMDGMSREDIERRYDELPGADRE